MIKRIAIAAKGLRVRLLQFDAGMRQSTLCAFSRRSRRRVKKGISILTAEPESDPPPPTPQTLLDTFKWAPVAMAILRADGKALAVNDQFATRLGSSAETLKGLDLLGYCDYQPDTGKDVQGAGETGAVAVGDRAATFTWPQTSGNVSRFAMTITAGVLAEGQLLVSLAPSSAAEEELERFFSIASHDLQEPLRKISAFVNALQRRIRSATEDKDALYELGRLDSSARRMSSMLKGLLTFSQAPRHYPTKIHCSLAQLLDAARAELTILSDQVPHEVRLQRDGPLTVNFEAMSLALQHILGNCFIHAACAERLIITVTYEALGPWVRITVADNGPALAFDLLDDIFTPLSRYCDKSVPGDGMGLALCQKIVRAHSGQIRAERYGGEDANKANTQRGLGIVIDLPRFSTNA